MLIHIKSYGRMQEFIKSGVTNVDAVNTEQLMKLFSANSPGFENVLYRIAINNKVIDGNSPISENDEIGLLPPFAGG